MDFDDLDAFGNNNFTHELDDLEVAIDFLISNAEAFRVDINRIYLVGHSRGGGIVILKAAEDSRVRSYFRGPLLRDFARHITVQDIRYWREAGVFYVENSRTGQQMPLYPQLYENYYRNRNRLNILKAAERLKVPFLIIHGDEDETVPVDHATRIE
ncbi:MAG: prolyl oligopeptidase family serine peptidase [Bacteroidetes bacterium]|nr:prolyl oligopeptidase family serine peptidase [Bacteroidota bacterium]